MDSNLQPIATPENKTQPLSKFSKEKEDDIVVEEAKVNRAHEKLTQDEYVAFLNWARMGFEYVK